MHRRIGSAVDAVFVAVVAAVLIIGGVASGCSRSSDASATTEATVESTPVTTEVADTTSTSVMTDEEAIVATYQGFWDAWLAANDPPDPNYPDLSRYYGGNALAVARAGIENHQRLGQIARLREGSQFGFTVETLAIEDPTASMLVCLIDDGILIDTATNAVIDDGIASIRFSVELERTEDHWIVTDHTQISSTEGPDGCDE